MKTTSITLTSDELMTLLDSLDAYRYWQLPGEHGLEHLRDSGEVRIDGIADQPALSAFSAVDALEARLEAVRGALGD